MSGLNWINIDYFLKNQGNSVKTNIKVNVPTTNIDDTISVFLYFNNINSVAKAKYLDASGLYELNGIPVGEEIKIVLIKKTEEDISAGVKEITLEENVVYSVPTSEFSLSELKNLIYSL